MDWKTTSNVEVQIETDPIAKALYELAAQVGLLTDAVQEYNRNDSVDGLAEMVQDGLNEVSKAIGNKVIR
jgi:hypothetical protein